MAIDLSLFKAKRDDPDLNLCMSLIEHTWRVLRAGIAIADRLPYGKERREYWKRKLIRCAIWHDIGKIHPAFQKNLKVGNSKGALIRHEIISLWMCEQCLYLEADELFAIATHHKGIIPVMEATGRRLSREDISNYLKSLLNESAAQKLLQQTPEIVAEWAAVFGDDTPQKTPVDALLQQPLSASLVSYLSEEGQQESLDDKLPFALMRGLLMAADHLGSSLSESELPNYKPLYPIDFQPTKKVNGKRQRISFRPFQEKMQSFLGDCLLHAPTGSGKTEAALSWVHANQRENSRLFYLLPFTASINAMVERLQRVYGKSRVTALHSKSLDFFYQEAMEESGNFEQSQERARNKQAASKELFHPAKVATLHQILKHGLHGKGWDMALHDYQNALFIVDEFHTYDAHLTGMMIATLQFLKRECSISILLMSATIPSFLSKIISVKLLNGDATKIIRPDASQPLDAAILNRIRHKLRCHPRKTIMDEIALVEEYMKNEETNVLIVVNNVKSCQDLGQTLARFNPTLLHGGFNREDRKNIEEKITAEDRKDRPRLLIATQAVEVSLDIDYAVALIENAPIDALIQRFGRVNRSGSRKVPATIHLFENSIGNVEKIYPRRLKETWDELSTRNGAELSEQMLMEVCDKVYQGGYSEEEATDFQIGFQVERISRFREMILAAHWLDWVEEVIEQSSMKIEVLCQNLLSEYINRKDEGRFIEAAQLIVQVYPWVVPKDERLYNEQNSVIIAQNLHYDPLVGFTKKAKGAGVFDDDF